MSRIFFDQSQRLSNVLAEFGKYRQSVGQVYRVYKFRKCGTGITRLTTQGERDFNKYSTNRTSQFINIYNGKAPIVVVWNNSTALSTYDGNMKIKKETTIGDYYYMFGNNNFTVSMQNDNLNLLGKDYVTQYISKTLILESRDWKPNNDDIVDYIYMVIDSRSQSYQWLELTNYEPTYNEETKEYQYGIFTFETINTKYATTGKTLLDFIQLGSQGEGHAFPMEVENKDGEIEVQLDPNVNDYYTLGTKYLQIDFMSGVALSSIFIYGREKITDPNDIKPTKILLPHKMVYPSMSPFFFNTPVSNFFRADNVQPTKKGIWKSYKENYKGNDRIGEYNILNKKEVLCGLQLNKFKAEQSNPIINGKYLYNIWEERSIYEINKYDFFGLIYNPWFSFSGDSQTSFTTTLCDWLSINNMYNTPYDVFNYEYEEVTKYKLTDTVGIMGGIVNAFIGGLDIGWTSSISKGLSLPMNLLIPCNSFNDGFLALNNDAPLPIDVFIQDKESHVLPVSTNIMSSYKFSLTDRYKDIFNTKSLQPEGRGGNGIWDTKYLGQTKYEDGTLINSDGSSLKINVSTFKSLPPSEEKEKNCWIIDGVGYYAVGITDTRVTAYDTDDNNSYEAYFETNSKARGDVRIWKNFIKFNCYENFNTEGKLAWPSDIIIPKPEGEDYIVEEMVGQNITKPLDRKQWFGYISNIFSWGTNNVPTVKWIAQNKLLSVFDDNYQHFYPKDGEPLNVGLNFDGSGDYITSDAIGSNTLWVLNTFAKQSNVTPSKRAEYYNKLKKDLIIPFNDEIYFNNDKFLGDISLYEKLELTLDYKNFPNATQKVSIPIPLDGDKSLIDLDVNFDMIDYGLTKIINDGVEVLEPFYTKTASEISYTGNLLTEMKILKEPLKIGLSRVGNKLTFIFPKLFLATRYIFTKESELLMKSSGIQSFLGYSYSYIKGTSITAYIDVKIREYDTWCVSLNNENLDPFGPTITNAVLIGKK